MTLRDYQIDAIDATRAAMRAGARRVCLTLPTGSGKTCLVAEIIRRAAAEHGKRALVLAHRTELVEQAASALLRHGLDVGAWAANARVAVKPSAPVQVASVQTLIARGVRPPADLVVSDEAHHYAAAEWSSVLRDYPGSLIIGPTATPERSDGIGLHGLFDALVVGARPSELIAGGWLVPTAILRPSDRLKPSQIAQRPVDAYLRHAQGRRAIVFCSRVAEARKAMQDFRIARLSAEMITGTTPWDERRKAFADLRSGKLNAVLNVAVATEGFDLPEVDCVILSRAFATAGTFLQATGRGLRPSPGKTDLLILDLVGATHVHGSPADDREFSLDGRGIRRTGVGVQQAYCRVCGAPLETSACQECGFGTRLGKPLKVVNRALIPYASKRAEPPERRVETLKRWVGEAHARHYKPGYAFGRFRAVYGVPPTAEELKAAGFHWGAR